MTPFYRYLHYYLELERVLGCFEKFWSLSTPTLHRRSIDVPSTRNLGGISKITFWKIIKILEIFSKNRSKNFLKHFFENLSCAFFIGMILYLKWAFPGTLHVRKCGTNLFGNPNRLQNIPFYFIFRFFNSLRKFPQTLKNFRKLFWRVCGNFSKVCGNPRKQKYERFLQEKECYGASTYRSNWIKFVYFKFQPAAGAKKIHFWWKC